MTKFMLLLNGSVSVLGSNKFELKSLFCAQSKHSILGHIRGSYKRSWLMYNYVYRVK